MQNLKQGQAVQLGEDVFIGNLGYGVEILVNDTYRVNGGEVSFTSEDTFKKVIKGKRVIDYYENGDKKFSKEEYFDLMKENKHKYWDDEVEEYIYPDLDTEYDCKKKLLELEMMKPVYQDIPESYEDYEFEVVGQSVDTGSDFIEQPFSFGVAVWQQGVGAFKIKTGNIARDEVEKARKEYPEYNWDMPTHSNIEFVKLDNDYIFTKSPESYIKTVSTVRYATDLTAAKEIEKSVRENIRKRLNISIAKKYPKTINDLTAQQILTMVAGVVSSYNSIEPKQKSSNAYYAGKKKLNEITELLEKYLLEVK